MVAPNNSPGLGAYINYDPTQENDEREGKFHEPQVITDSWRPTTMWSHRIDNTRAAAYELRQAYAAPHTLLGWLRVPCLMFVGMGIRYLLQWMYPFIGYYTAIPAAIIILPILLSVLIAFKQRATRFSSLGKLFFMTLGVVL